MSTAGSASADRGVQAARRDGAHFDGAQRDEQDGDQPFGEALRDERRADDRDGAGSAAPCRWASLAPVPLERIDSVCARHAAKILTLSANRQWTEVTSRGPLCLYTARVDTIVASGRRR